MARRLSARVLSRSAQPPAPARQRVGVWDVDRVGAANHFPVAQRCPCFLLFGKDSTNQKRDATVFPLATGHLRF